MANKRLDSSKQALILAALCEGIAINSVCRMFKVGKHAVLRMIEETGEACEDWHHRHFRNLSVERLELDEQWAYVHTHRERMSKEERYHNPDRGDCWLWAAIDPESKAIISWRSGKRTREHAEEFCEDIAGRLTVGYQICSDNLPSYEKVVTRVFAGRADYAVETKRFAQVARGPEILKSRSNPLVGMHRVAVMGTPNLKTATVCHLERFFLTMRQSNKRCARKTLAYSKDWGNHALMASIHIFVYNLVRKHETIKTTPAMALGATDHRWTLEHVVEMTEAYWAAKDTAAFEAAFSKFS
jgi:IS1 family transposase